jgi:predicted CoA-substrate-specific enzyme activase
VIIDEDGMVLASCLAPSGGNYRLAAEQVIRQALQEAALDLEDLDNTVATGFGAANLPFRSRQVTEISCQGKAINHLFPSAKTVIDVGGQQTRVISLDGDGRAVGFAVSEKCAAGSGRFMQVIARVMQISLNEIGPLSVKSANPVSFSTGCAVFAESEVISRIAEGWSKEDILAGVHNAVAAKIYNLVLRVRLQPECAITGGGAKDVGLIKAVEEKTATSLLVPEAPQLTCAYGAALMAMELV